NVAFPPLILFLVVLFQRFVVPLHRFPVLFQQFVFPLLLNPRITHLIDLAGPLTLYYSLFHLIGHWLLPHSHPESGPLWFSVHLRVAPPVLILLQLLAFLPRFFLVKTRRSHHDSTSFPLIQMLLPILHSQLSFVMCRSRLTDQPDPLLPDYFLPT